MTPVHLNAAIAWLFIAGSACFVLGSVPAFVNAVGGQVDGITYFVGSLFFTSASFLALLQAQTPAMTSADLHTGTVPATVRWWSWLPHDRAWLAAISQFAGTLYFNVSTFAALVHNATVTELDRRVWRPDFVGSTLFLAASVLAILAIGRFWSVRPRSVPWRIAWLNMLGSILFMGSALASYVLPSGDVVSTRVSVVGTMLGAVCFLIAAALLFPAWKGSVRQAATDERGSQPSQPGSPQQ